MITGALCHFALLTAVLDGAWGLAALLDFDRSLAWIALSYFVAAALRIFAGALLWWADRSGRILYLISVCASVVGTWLLLIFNPTASLFLLTLFPPLVIVTLLFHGPLAEPFADEHFQTQVKLNTRSRRPYDAMFWAAHACLLLLAVIALATSGSIMT